jgi:16S rRNA (guanine527-N7)-methyltransferase
MMTQLKLALAENNFVLSPEQIQQLLTYLQLLNKWNRVFNLTNITTERDMVYLHIIDSLAVSPYLSGEYCFDIGTGAGLPGIPLSIVHPQLRFTLVDKNGKKTRFLTQVCAELSLKNVSIVQSRCEALHPESLADCILSRAYSSLALFVESCAHLLSPRGKFLAMKGKYPEEELQALPAGFEVQKIITLSIKGINIDRHIVEIVKK